MVTLLLRLLRLLPLLCGAHRHVALENLALRHQLTVYKRTVTRPRRRRTDRLFFSSLKRFVKSTARGSFQLLLSLLLLDENDRRACGRARCARFVILLFALSVASGDSPAHDG